MKSSFLFVPLICSSLLGMGQTTSMDVTMKKYAEQYQPEKLHIHFDKDAYLPGETIWLKAYLMEGFKPSEKSGNIYFDWTDADGNLLLHSVSPVMESSATTSFILPIDFKGGAIHVKSYTQFMLNFDSSFLYNKNIPVLSEWDGTAQIPEKHNTAIRFFPEGGDLVAGISSLVAFEARDLNGRPANVRGVIQSGSGNMVDSFFSRHDGMGSFRIQPAASEKYTAYWKDEYGNSHTTELPSAKTGGLVMTIEPRPDNSFHYQIERTTDAGDALKSLTIISTAQQQVVSKSNVDIKDKTTAEGILNTEQMTAGVMQVTILDINMNPVAERVVFVNNHQYGFTTQVRNDVVNFARKGKNEISIEIPYGFTADLSVSVTDGGLNSDSSNNIVTDFLLANDIRGYVANPAYYFSNNTDSSKQYLDLVMLTHGWRRFKWEDVVIGKLPELLYQPDGEYMSFKGQVAVSNMHFDPTDSMSLLLITKDKKKSVLSLPIASDGSFGQKGMFFYDSVQIVYRMNHASKLSSGSEINFHTSLLPAGILSSTAAANPSFQWSKVPDVILEKEINGLLAELKNYSREARGMNYVITPHAKMDSLKSTSETAAHYLENNFPGMKFPYAPKESSTETGDNRYASLQKTPGMPAAGAGTKYNINLVLDGTSVTMDDLKQISMKEVLFLKFLQKSSPKELQTLVISSRQSIDQNNIVKNKTGFAVLRGYTPAKEFYVPQYSGTPEDDQTTDYRSTLYWNPRVILDKDHRKISLSFYNNDMSNKFRVVVEGMNKEGKLTRIEEIIK
jgi:hypothetical protein